MNDHPQQAFDWLISLRAELPAKVVAALTQQVEATVQSAHKAGYRAGMQRAAEIARIAKPATGSYSPAVKDSCLQFGYDITEAIAREAGDD